MLIHVYARRGDTLSVGRTCRNWREVRSMMRFCRREGLAIAQIIRCPHLSYPYLDRAPYRR